MMSYAEYLNLPTIVCVILAVVFLISQIIGEILELKGKVVPEWIKIRKFFKRKREEKKAIQQLPKMIEKFQSTLDSFNQHYSKDNITKRNQWMKHIDDKECTYDQEIKMLTETLNKVSHTVVDIQIDNKRSQIIDFARTVSCQDTPVTREQFNRIFKMYADYEKIIEENGMTNGEIEIAHSIIVKSYTQHMENHSFIEDLQD